MIQLGKHHDPNEPWAREPRLRTVVHLPLRRRQRGGGYWVYLTCIGIGVVLGLLLRGWQ